MRKKIAAVMAMLCASAAFAAFASVDVNQASVADLDGLRGVGPALSRRILEARQQREFKDWNDFMARVKGVKPKAAARLSAEGLTVNGEAYKGAGR